MNTATPAYQSVAELKLAVAVWGPAALARTYSRSEEPALVWVPMVKGRPAELPGVTVPGWPPVMMPPTTSSPLPTEAVAPELTELLFPLAAAVWSSAPLVAMPENSETAPCR